MSDIRAAMELADVVGEELRKSGHSAKVGRIAIDGAASLATSAATGSHAAGMAAGHAASHSVSDETAGSIGEFAAGLGVGVACLVASPFIMVGAIGYGIYSLFKED